MAESLKRLGLDYVDALYLHDPERHDLELAEERAIPALVSLRERGLVQRVGVGSMSTEALAVCAETGMLDELMIAGRFTLLEQPAADHVLPACERTGTRVVAASVFNSGLLAKRRPDPSARYEYGDVPEAIQHRLERLIRVCDAFDVALPAAALQFVERNALVDAVVIAASRPDQVSENVASWRASIPEPFWRHLEGELTNGG